MSSIGFDCQSRIRKISIPTLADLGVIWENAMVGMRWKIKDNLREFRLIISDIKRGVPYDGGPPSVYRVFIRLCCDVYFSLCGICGLQSIEPAEEALLYCDRFAYFSALVDL